MNVTDATCDFGLAQTAAGCVRSLASYDPSAYLHFQIGYCAVGVGCMVASAVMYARAVIYDGSPLQQYNFLFCCYASVTVLFRGVDPGSYGHVIPRPIIGLLSDSSTAALYSVYILALGYWATIIQKGAAVTNRPTHLKALEGVAIAVVWMFYIGYNMSLFLYKGFQPLNLIYMELTVSACILGVISTVFLVYGLRVLSRLQAFERQKKLHIPSLSERMMNNRSFNMELSDDEYGIPVVGEPRYSRRRPQEGHAHKIRMILLVAETVSLIVIGGQMYFAVSRSTNTPVELSCANGMLCETVKTAMALKTARNGVLIVSWAAMTKEYVCDVNYGMGVSMVPTIPDGSFIFVERLSRRWRNLERGDLVQLRSPTRHRGETITKRILAMVCRDVVELQPRFDEERKGKITVPKGHVWVEGDNPTCSVDSRHFGAVPAALVIGRPFWIVRLRGVEHYLLGIASVGGLTHPRIDACVCYAVYMYVHLRTRRSNGTRHGYIKNCWSF
ncbi:hypothetical protein BBJ28_00003656 [Nothophytophthora sp. Chile5]|nr:hypothetical protein BBJ28_00003656 [Nothophytophthora sp. Chile5]